MKLIEDVTRELANPECVDPHGLAFSLSIFFSRRAAAEESIRHAMFRKEAADEAVKQALLGKSAIEEALRQAREGMEQAKVVLGSALEAAKLAREAKSLTP